MDMANHGFLGKRALATPDMNELLADASRREAWRQSVTRSLLEDLRSTRQSDAGDDQAHPYRQLPPMRHPAGPRELYAQVVHPGCDPFLAGPGRKKGGERKRQILSGFLDMLAERRHERITTSGLAKYLDYSEASLYRHFENKTQMLESLIVMVEESVIERAAALGAGLERFEEHRAEHAAMLVRLFMGFAETYPGLSRLMAGDALVVEDEFLRDRMGLFFIRFENLVAEVLRGRLQERMNPASEPSAGPDQASVLASSLCAICVGMLARYASTGFERRPSVELEGFLTAVLGTRVPSQEGAPAQESPAEAAVTAAAAVTAV